MASGTFSDRSLYSDKERLLRSDSDDDLERLNSPPTSRWSSTPVLLMILCLALVASIFSFIALEQKSQRPFTIPVPPPQEVCEHATSRPSWHDLPLHRRRGYTRAVQRLTILPSRLGLNTSLYDDFTYVHIQQVWQTHHAAISLPYHRYFVYVFEQALRNEGGYDGPMPFWDWTLDAARPLESPIWDTWAGFGGNGSSSDGCVEEGVFGRIGKATNYTEFGYQPHCVSRSFEDSAENGMMHSKQWTKEMVNDILESSKTYDAFRERLENGPHRHLHRGIGGEMPTASSTNGTHNLADHGTELTR